jgi:hypothetical protein
VRGGRAQAGFPAGNVAGSPSLPGNRPCATGKDVACGLGIASLGLSGASYGLGKLAENWEALSNAALRERGIIKPLAKGIGWGFASAMAQVGGYSAGAYGTIATGVSSLPCHYIQSEGC